MNSYAITGLSDIINAMTSFGPGWAFVTIVVASAIVIIFLLRSSIENFIQTRTEKEKADVEVNRERFEEEKRVNQERHERDGQMIELLSESNRVIERNSQGFREMVAQLDKSAQRDELTISNLQELNGSVSNLKNDVDDRFHDFEGLLHDVKQDVVVMKENYKRVG